MVRGGTGNWDSGTGSGAKKEESGTVEQVEQLSGTACSRVKPNKPITNVIEEPKTIGGGTVEQENPINSSYDPAPTHIIHTTRRKISPKLYTRDGCSAVPTKAKEDKQTLEGYIERRLKKEAERRGWICFKFESPGNRGVPDRIIIKDDGTSVYVETKRPKGGRTSKLQDYQIGRIRRQNARVYKIKNIEELEEFFRKEAMPNEVHST